MRTAVLQPCAVSAAYHACAAGRVGCLACGGPLFRSVVRALRVQRITFSQTTLHLSLVDNLCARGSHSVGQVVGVTDIEVMGLATICLTARATDVRIVKNLPSVRFQVVAAHELGHVWLANQRALSIPPWCNEGFCELLAYRFAAGLNSWDGRLERARIITNPDPTYGGGFRRLKAFCDRAGFDALCAAIQTNRLASL